MFCTKCSTEISNKAEACPQCGVPIAGQKATTASPVVVSNHMVLAVLTTVFCCLIGGIISIVYASKVNTKLAQGDIAGAQAASKTALLWIIINLITLPLIGIIGIMMGALFPAISGTMQSAQSSVAAAHGRNLFLGMTIACTEREAAGLQGVWPHTEGSPDLSDNKKDIAGIPFRNSTD